MDPLAEMIVHNVMGPHSPEDTRLLVTYTSEVLRHYTPTFNRAKMWHDCIFRPRYYYTTCARTLELLQCVKTSEMTRHVIMLEGSSMLMTTPYLLEIESVLKRIVDAGFYLMWNESVITTDSYVAFKGGRVEFILEGRPFEQEYVTDMKAFHQWLDRRLPLVTLMK